MIFAHFFIFLLFVHYVNSKEVLKIGFLKHPNYPQVLGAISLAVQKINNDSNILPKTQLEFIFGDLPSKKKYKISLTPKGVYLQKSVKSMKSVGLKYILTDFWRHLFFKYLQKSVRQ